MDTMFFFLDDAKKYKSENEKYVGKYTITEESILLRIVIVQMTPTEFGKKWAEQPETFEEQDLTMAITRQEFDLQMEAFENADLTKKDGHFYEVLGCFHSANNLPRFQPMHMLLADGFL